MTPVTLLTKDASLDSMSLADYADAFAELRQTAGSLDKFVTMVTSQYSKAQWSKFEHGELTPTRQMRNEIRRGVGLPELPMTVTEVTAQASPDAAVWSVGEGVPERILMLAGVEPITVHVNGDVTVLPKRAVTEVTRRQRPPVVRPVVSVAQNDRRLACNASWRDVIEAGLQTLETRGI